MLMARHTQNRAPMPKNSQANMSTGSSRVVSGTICRKKRRRRLLRRFSTLTLIDSERQIEMRVTPQLLNGKRTHKPGGEGGTVRVRWRLVVVSTLCCVLAIQAQELMRKHAREKSTIDPAWSELQSSMEKMHMSMASIKPSGETDDSASPGRDRDGKNPTVIRERSADAQTGARDHHRSAIRNRTDEPLVET